MKSSHNDNDILIYIGNYEKKFQQPPTLEDIMKRFGIGKQATKSAISRLRKEGYFNEQKKKKPRKAKSG